MATTATPILNGLSINSDSGSSDTDGVTDIATPVVVVTTAAGAKITLYDGDRTVIGFGTAATDGVDLIPISQPLPDGDHVLTATAQVSGLAVSAMSKPLGITVDTAAPDAPPAPALTADSDTGTSQLDGITSDATPTVTGHAEAGATVRLYADGGTTAIGTAQAGDDGSYTITAARLGAGDHTLTVTATDLAGNVSDASPATAVTIDTTAPGAPPPPFLVQGSDTGELATDNVTADDVPTVVGTAEPGSTVELIDAVKAGNAAFAADGTLVASQTILEQEGAVLGTATVGEDGRYTVEAADTSGGSRQGLADGAYALRVVATDAAGNQSAGSAPLDLVVDTAIPTYSIAPYAVQSDAGEEVFKVQFSSPIAAPSIDDFTLATTGTAEGAVRGVVADGTAYLVTVTKLGGAGTFTLDVDPQAHLADQAGTVFIAAAPPTPATVSGDAASLTVPVATDAEGDGFTPGADSLAPDTGFGGRFVVFGSDDPNLVPDEAGNGFNVFVKDLLTGAISEVAVDAASPQIGNGAIAYDYNDSTASSSDIEADVAVIDTTQGSPDQGSVYAPAEITAKDLSAAANGAGILPPGVLLSGDGKTVAFNTYPPNELDSRVYLADVASGALTLVPAPVDPADPDGTLDGDFATSLSYDGTQVGFEDGQNAWVYDSADATTLALTATGAQVGSVPDPKDVVIDDPFVDANGNVVTYTAYNTKGNTLDPSDGSVVMRLDLTTGAITQVTPFKAGTFYGAATTSANGRYVLYSDNAAFGLYTDNAPVPENTQAGDLFLYDAVTGTTTKVGFGAYAQLEQRGSAFVYEAAVPGTTDTQSYETSFGVTGSIGAIGTRDMLGPQALTASALTVGGATNAPDGSLVTVKLLAGATTLYTGSGTASGGTWTASIPTSGDSALADGSYTVSVLFSTSMGASRVITRAFTVDTTLPATPDAPTLDPASDTARPLSGSVEEKPYTGSITDSTTPTLDGRVDPGATVRLYDADGSDPNFALGTAVADQNGFYAITPTAALAQGLHSLSVIATDVNGAVSAASDALTLTVDSVAPAAFTGLTVDNTLVKPDQEGQDLLVDAVTPEVEGTAEAGALVTLTDSDGKRVLGTATADAKGEFTITSALLAQGDHKLNLEEEDYAGNTIILDPGIAVTVDTVAPDAPVVDQVGGQLPDGHFQPDVTVGGTAEDGATVKLYADGDDTVYGTATVEDGRFTIDSSTLPAGDLSLTVTATDAAGNASQHSVGVAVTVEGSAPAVAVAPPPNDPNATPGTTGTGTLVNGTVSDDLIAGATVFADANGNGVLDPGEDFGISSSQGQFSTYGAGVPLVSTGGVDIGTGLVPVGPLKAPAYDTNGPPYEPNSQDTGVTPLSTYVYACEQISGLPDTVATSTVAAAKLGYSGSYGAGNTEVEDAEGGSVGNFIIDVKLMDLATDVAALVTASGGAAAAGFSAAFDAVARLALRPTTTTVDFGSAATVEGLIQDAFAEALPGQTLADSVAGTAAQAIVAGNAALDAAASVASSAASLDPIDAVATVEQGALATALGGLVADPSTTAAVLAGFTGAALQTRVAADTRTYVAAELAPADDTGASDQDEITDTTMPRIAGTAAPGATITVVEDGTEAAGDNHKFVVAAVGQADAAGHYSVPVSLPAGQHRLTVIEGPLALPVGALVENTETGYAAVRMPDAVPSNLIVVDTVPAGNTAPSSVTIEGVQEAAGPGSDATHGTLFVTGTIGAADDLSGQGDVIDIYADGGTAPVASGLIDQDGTAGFSLVTSALGDGAHQLNATVTDRGGLVLATSAPFAAQVAAPGVQTDAVSGGGALAGATVYVPSDSYSYGPLSDELRGTTGASGTVPWPVAAPSLAGQGLFGIYGGHVSRVLAQGGTDSFTGLPYGGALARIGVPGTPQSPIEGDYLEAPTGSQQITPLTSLLTERMALDITAADYDHQGNLLPGAYAIVYQAATDDVDTALGLPAGTDIQTLDPLAAAEGGDPRALIASLKLVDTMVMVDAAGGIGNFSSIARLVTGGSALDLDDPATIAQLFQYFDPTAKQEAAATIAASNAALDALTTGADGTTGLLAGARAIATLAQDGVAEAFYQARSGTTTTAEEANFAAVEQAYTGAKLQAAVTTELGEVTQVVSFDPNGPSPTGAGTADFTITFSRAVSGVTAGDFAVTTSSLGSRPDSIAGATVESVTPVAGSRGTAYDVAVSTGVGVGTLSLAFAPNGVLGPSGGPVNSGAFQEPVHLSNQTTGNNTNVGVNGIAVGDLTGDGRPDIVTSNDSDIGGLTVYLNQGGGRFTAEPAISDGPDVLDSETTPTGVALADVDGDGKLDLLSTTSFYGDGFYSVSSSAGYLVVRHGEGDGTFAAATLTPIASGSIGLVTADLNGDGRADAVITDRAANGTSGAVEVLLGDGDGTFTAAQTLAVAGDPGHAVVADLDRDGHPDIAVTDQTDHDVAIYFGKRDGTFGAPTLLPVDTEPLELAVGDVNGDGIPDIVVLDAPNASTGAQKLSVFLGQGGGAYKALPDQTITDPDLTTGQPDLDLDSISLADVDGDGVLDVVASGEALASGGGGIVLRGNGDGTFAPGYGIDPTGNNADSAPLAVADLDGDGRTDVVRASAGTSTGATTDGDGIDVILNGGAALLPATSTPLAVSRGAAAAPGLTETSGPGTLTADGSAYTLDLGTLAQGQAVGAIALSLLNAAAAGADAFSGRFAAPSGSGFTATGTGFAGTLAPGESYDGLGLTVDTSAAGQHSYTLTFAPEDTDTTDEAVSPDDFTAQTAAVTAGDPRGLALAPLTLTVTDDVAAPTAPLAALGAVAPVSFGNVRVGTVDSRALAIANMAAAGSGSLAVSAAASGEAGVTGSVAALAPGATDATDLVVGLDTSVAGARSGSVTLTPSSVDATGTATPLTPVPVAVSGAVYRPAAATIALVNATVHVGDPGTLDLDVANGDPADGYSENLVAALTAATGGFTGSGSTGEIAAGASDATSLALSFSTVSAGVIAGTATVGLTSDGGAAGAASAVDGLGTLALPSASVPVSVTVDNYAQAGLAETSGGGTFSATAGGYTLDLGIVAQGSAPVTVALAALNAAAGPADLLSGSFTAAGSAAFTNALAAVTGIAAGGSQAAGTVTLSTAAAGAVSDTVTLAPTGSNASGFSAAVAGKTLTIRADVAPAPTAAQPTVTAVAVSGPGIAPDGSGDLGAGSVATITATTSAPVTVAGGTPTLALSDGGTATYAGGSGTNQLTFSYTVQPGEDTTALSVTDIAGNGAGVTSAAGLPLDLASLATAARPSGALAIDTAAPVVSSLALTVAQNAPATAIGIAAPSDNITPAGGLAVTVTGLPDDGTVTLADGATPVTANESLSSAQLLGLEFTPTPGASSPSSRFTYTVTDRAGNATTGTATLSVGAAGTPPGSAPPLPMAVPPASGPPAASAFGAPDAVSISHQVTYRDGVATLTGTASSLAGVGSVEISALVDGARQDLGTATVGADGSFDFYDLLGADRQAFFVATLTDGAGRHATSTDPGFNLTGRLGPEGETAREEEFNSTGQVSTALLRPDAQRFLSVAVPDLPVMLRPFDHVANHHEGGTSFVFMPTDGSDLIGGFQPWGADHDTLEVPSSVFRNFAAVLRDTADVNGIATITDPRTGDSIQLPGVTASEVRANPKDFIFHA